MTVLSMRPTSSWLTNRITRLGKDYVKVLEADLVADYAKDLKGYPQQIIDQACTNARREYDFFPSVSQLIRECDRLQRPHYGGEEKRYLCDPNCECQGSGFLYGKYFSERMQREYDGVYPCPRRMKKASQSA